MFNSTSVAAYTIGKHITQINKHRFAIREYHACRMSLFELNERLIRLGRKPLSVPSVVSMLARSYVYSKVGWELILHNLLSLDSGYLLLSGYRVEVGFQLAVRYYRKLKAKGVKSKRITATDPGESLDGSKYDESPAYVGRLFEMYLAEYGLPAPRKSGGGRRGNRGQGRMRH